jgi:hypothetical protein
VFNAAYSLYTARGGELTTTTRITNYFDAITMVDDPQINGISLHLRQRFLDNPDQFTLHGIQMTLQADEDRIDLSC